MKVFRPLLFVIVVFTVSMAPLSLDAQEQDGPTSTLRARLYTVTLPGGEYMVDLGSVTSVSLHKFYVDGAFAVHEVTVDTTGSTVARFYFVERNKDVTAPRGIGQSLLDRTQNKVDEVKDRAGVPSLLDEAVVKSYPTTTHAHTVEYRITSLDQLEKLYQDIKTKWQRVR
ncbi:MAG: hypothetical protein AAF571_05755 [Verrucomicrobiota bacterium]